MDKTENSTHGYTEGAETPEAKGPRHYMLYNRIAVLPDGMEFLKAVNEGITELKSLRSELQKQTDLTEFYKQSYEKLEKSLNTYHKQRLEAWRELEKQKELNAELVAYVDDLLEDHKNCPWMIDNGHRAESLIKKYKES